MKPKTPQEKKALSYAKDCRNTYGENDKASRKAVTEFLSTLEIETEIETDGRWIAEAKQLDGVLVYGETEEKAVSKCRRLARMVYLEQIGAGRILTIDDNFISVVTYQGVRAWDHGRRADGIRTGECGI